MGNMEQLINLIRYEYQSDFSIKEFNEYKDGKLDSLYGMETYNITDTDIEALKNGKLLYSSINGEYAIVIGLGSAIYERDSDARKEIENALNPVIAKIFPKEDSNE